MIKIEHLQKAYSAVTPLKDVSVEINKGDVISIIGPSGAGKSTFIRCINLLETPTAGKIWVDGECITDKDCDISKVRQKMGMVFQAFNLFPHLTVIENIMAAPTDVLGIPRQQAYDEGIELLRTVGMADKAFEYPDSLSGGQKQRVAIARALAMKPEVMLFDEPTSALDPTMIGEVKSVIRDLSKKGMTMMIVTHEMSFARDVANRVFYMDEGGIYEDGTPEQIFDNPQREKTKRFIKKIRVYENEIHSKDFDFIGFNSGLEEFGRKNDISKKTIYRAQAVFEELCVQIILQRLPESFNLYAAVSCFKEEDKIFMELKYSGDIFDPRDTDNLLSLKLAQNAAESINFSKINEDTYTNLVSVVLK